MIITVRHLMREDYREMSCLYNDSERFNFAVECLTNNRLIRVADIAITEHQTDLLNIAYDMTNSINKPWYLHSEIDVAEIAQDGCRSTSIGDIIQMEGRSFVVLGCGFKEIKKG